MRKTLTILLLAMLLSLLSKAESWTPETLPMVHLQDARRYVCNPDGVLSQAATDSTDRILYALERDKGVQTVVVVVKRIEGADAYQFGMDLGRKYGVGSKTQRTGLILILSTEDRLYQILTGNGLEGTLPDAICRRIENRVMVPLLKEEKWDSAIVCTIKSIDGYVRGDESLKAEAADDEDDVAATSGMVIAILFVIIFFIAVSRSIHRLKCPHCKKTYMRVARRQRVKVGGLRAWQQRITYRCPRCGHEEVRYEDDSGFNGGIFVPPVYMGGTGGIGSGGGFSAGSFGGGGSGGSF